MKTQNALETASLGLLLFTLFITTPALAQDASTGHDIVPLAPEASASSPSPPPPGGTPAPPADHLPHDSAHAAPATGPAPVAIPPRESPPRWRRGHPVPPGYRVATRARKGLLIPGVVLLTTSWTISAFAGWIGVTSVRKSGEDDGRFTALYVPFAGPFISLSRLDYTDDSQQVAQPFLILDALIQAGSVAMIIAGLAWRKPYLVADHTAGRPALRWTAWVGPQTGVGLVGSF